MVALRIELSAPWLSAEDGQPALDYRLVSSSSYGNRTHLSALKGRNPKPIDERAVSARTVGREALESSSAAFQTAARPSQLPTQTKKARCRCDTGLREAPFGFEAERQQRSGCAGSVFTG